MKDSYFRYQEPQMALSSINLMPLVVLGDKHWLVTSVASNRAARGRGWIRQLLADMCAQADAEQVTLYLSVDADPDMDEARLVRLYRSHGFDWHNAGTTWEMIRTPMTRHDNTGGSRDRTSYPNP